MLERLPEASLATIAALAQEDGVTTEQLITARLYSGRRTGGALMCGGCAWELLCLRGGRSSAPS